MGAAATAAQRACLFSSSFCPRPVQHFCHGGKSLHLVEVRGRRRGRRGENGRGRGRARAMVRARVRGLEIGVVLTLLALAGACGGGTLPLALTCVGG